MRISDLGHELLGGDIRALARGISLVEENAPRAVDLLREVFPETGRARVLGITGPPGAALEAISVRRVSGSRVETLVRLRGRGGPDAAVDGIGAGARLLQWSRSAYTPAGTPVVADLEGDGAFEVVVQSGTGEVVSDVNGPQAVGGLFGRNLTNIAVDANDKLWVGVGDFSAPGMTVIDTANDSVEEALIGTALNPGKTVFCETN